MTAPFLDAMIDVYPITQINHFPSGSGSINAPFNGKLFLRCRGPGAAGGSANPGDGGGGGGYSDKLVASVTSGETWNYVVGSSGTASSITGPGSVVSLVSNSGVGTAPGTASGGDNNVSRS